MKNKLLFLIVLVIVVGFLFRNWFSSGLISSGDFGYLYNETIAQMQGVPYLWDTSFGNGLGGDISFILPLNTFYFMSAFVLHTLFGFDWVLIERLVWFWPYLFVSIFSSIYVFKNMFPKNPFWFVSPIIFVCNSYALMLVSGGQLGVAMGYALSPLIVWIFTYEIVRVQKYTLIKGEVLAGLLLALQVLFDPRMAFVSMCVVGIFFLMHIGTFFRWNGVRILFIPLGTAILLHMFWLLPLIIGGRNPIAGLGTAYSSALAVAYFSFADFPHAFSLLHPNWPENIFGKTSFMQPEFLVIPLLAFSALLFIKKMSAEKYQKSHVLFFACIGIFGAFLSKGANPLFGNLYVWIFEHVPGFIMFRDPSKFYVLVVLSYSVLVPVALHHIMMRMNYYARLSHKVIGTVSVSYVLISLFFLLCWGFIHREFIVGKLGGTFVSYSLPQEYVQLKDYFNEQPEFSRVLWVPRRQRFGFSSQNKPALSLESFHIASVSSFVDWIASEEAYDQLQRFGVSDIVIPTDPLGELFISDRQYDDAMRTSVIDAIDLSGKYQRKIIDGKIVVYGVPDLRGHAFFDSPTKESVHVTSKNTTEYSVTIPNQSFDSRLVFSESYSPYWRLFLNDIEIHPKRTSDGLLEYLIPKNMHGVGIIRYVLQDSVVPGLWISAFALVIVGGILWRYR